MRFVENDDEGQGVLPDFVFSNETITLDEHHGESVQIGLRQAMEYITSKCDRSVVLEQPFIQQNMQLIKLLSEHTGSEPVRLFDFKQESLSTNRKVFDKSTWGGEDYTELAVAIICGLVNHANHQQRCENYVQLMGLIAQTNIGEVRRTVRAIIIGSIIRRFNAWGLKKLQSSKSLWKNKNKMPNRLTGSNKTYLFLEYLDQYFHDIDRANDAIDQMDIEKGRSAGDTRKRTIDYLKSQGKKSSNEERESFLKSVTDQFADDVPVYAAEAVGGVDVPADMGGKVLLCIFTGTRD